MPPPHGRGTRWVHVCMAVAVCVPMSIASTTPCSAEGGVSCQAGDFARPVRAAAAARGAVVFVHRMPTRQLSRTQQRQLRGLPRQQLVPPPAAPAATPVCARPDTTVWSRVCHTVPSRAGSALSTPSARTPTLIVCCAKPGHFLPPRPRPRATCASSALSTRTARKTTPGACGVNQARILAPLQRPHATCA